MDLRNLTYPDGYTRPDPDGPLVERYTRLTYYNPEICDNCFQKIRSVGEIIEKRGFAFNAYYERTEHASQEHDPFTPPTDRYGQCYCLNCGADTRELADILKRDELIHRAKNLVRYLSLHTDHAVDAHAMGRALHAFKSLPENQGYDTEILAMSAIVGMRCADADRSVKARA